MFKTCIKLFAVVAALLTPLVAHALAAAAAPTKIQIPFANSAGGAYVRTVPIASQIGIQNGAASYTDGFPPLNFTPVNAGGVPPFGQDMNGVLRDVSAHARWWAAGGPVRYDSAYQTAIGGYPGGAIVQSATVTGKLWYSNVDNNMTNPDTGGAGWAVPLNTVYAPLTGTGASGTWGINITGNAATANNAASATNATNATNAGNLTGTPTFFAPITNSLTSSVSLTNSALYFDGPSVAQGASGKWFASGTVTLHTNTSTLYAIKLWDGTTVIATTLVSAAAGEWQSVSLSGFISAPAGNLRISVRDINGTSSIILYGDDPAGGAGNGKASTITAFRIG